MKKIFFVFLVISLFLFSTTAVSLAGHRHGYRSNYNHYRSGFSHYRSYPRHHSSHSNHFWPYLGVGLVTGAVIGSLFAQPPRPQTIYYSSTPRVVVQSEPIIIKQQPRPASPPPQLILKQVKIVERIVNIRSGPGLENVVVDQARQDETIDVIGAAPEWLYVRTATGRYGWIMTQYTRETDRPVG